MVAVGITLQCFGTVLGPGFQGFLDGHTQDATLGLAPSIGDPFTGTMWSKDDSGTATTLQCLGFASDPRRFLDGHTQDATLGLAPTTDPPFTGTRWAMLQVPSVALQCLGDAPGPGFQGFLDGHTQDATLGLAATTDPPFTGTRWRANFQTGLNVSVQATKHQEGAFLTITGGGFPQGGQVDIALFGVPRRINPSEIFSATANEPGGRFTVSDRDERCTSDNPGDAFGDVIVVARDRASGNFALTTVSTSFWVCT